MHGRLTLAALLALATLTACATPREAPLGIYGNTSTLELAPVLLAAQHTGQTVKNGGAPDLFKPGGADVATNAETQALRISVDHPDLRIILTVSEGWYRIVARRSAGIASLADLKGKRIATVPSTSSAYYLHRMLATAHLSEADVTVVPILPLSGMADALNDGRVDAVTIWEPEVQRAMDAIGPDAIQFQDRSVYRELFNLNTTAGRLADPTARRRIVALVRRIARESSGLRRNPKPAWAALHAATGYDEALIARVWEHEDYPAALPADLLDVMVDEEAWLARQSKRSPRSRAELERLIDRSVLQEAVGRH
jgi:NitT/TauT family transport system substrate-binding protein